MDLVGKEATVCTGEEQKSATLNDKLPTEV